jgi:hypothetical protein
MSTAGLYTEWPISLSVVFPPPSSPTTSGIHHFLKNYFVLKFNAYQSGPNFSDTNFSICRGRDFNKNFTVSALSFLVQS